ncbi:MAG: glycosyltransferase family 1 protein [Geminicoccaceae bacterium]|nr:MAG: glycosyltransferase family 1 protein [Geminicoccaceae bacterium]
MVGKHLDGRTVLYLVTEDWYFWSHRLPVARAARDAGAKVIVATRLDAHTDRIAAEGFVPVAIPFDRSGLNPGRDLATLQAIRRTYRDHQPDLVHHVAAKPVLYGSIAARLAGVPAVVNAMAGLGALYVDEGRKVRLLRHLFEFGLKSAARRPHMWTIVQNTDDFAVFRRLGFTSDQLVLIRGSGIDLRQFQATPEPGRYPLTAVCVSRMLWHKGVGDLVEAARILQGRGVDLRVRLVGGTDANPASIAPTTLAAWASNGIVEVGGQSDDVAGEYAAANIGVLPSFYREGVPKTLLEAAACGRAMVATDVPGCREICRHEETGLLVPPRDPVALADALARLVTDHALRHRLAARARAVVETEFADHLVADATLEVYARALGA